MTADELGAPEHPREADEQGRAVAEAMQRVAGQGLDAVAKLRREPRRLLGLGRAVLALDAFPDFPETARGGEVERYTRMLVSRPDRGEPTGGACRKL